MASGLKWSIWALCIASLLGVSSTNAHAERNKATPLSGLISELRLGILGHDVDMIATRVENGEAYNLEIIANPLFKLGDQLNPFVRAALSPKPTLGIIYAPKGTDFVYLGATWSADITDRLFVNLFFGVAGHKGNAEKDTKVLMYQGKIDNYKNFPKHLGCHALFREGVDLGWRFGKQRNHKVMASFSHMSHGQILCNENRNAGMDHIGIRYGIEF